MTFPGIGTSKKVEIMTTAESILIQNIEVFEMLNIDK